MGERSGTADGGVARGGAALLLATAIAGGLGYVMQPLAASRLDAASYAQFAVAWAAVFGIAGALAGVQQEIARSAALGLAQRPRPWMAVVGIGAVPTVVIACAALLTGSAVTLAVAAAAVAATSLLVTTGFAYAAHAWRLVAATMVLEAVLRLVLLGVALLVDAPVLVLVCALVLPFVLTVVIVGRPVARSAAGYGLGVGGRVFARNVARTLVATAATAVIVSAFPIFLEASSSLPADELGAFLFAFTLTRAPFVIVFLALQSFLLKVFQAHLAHAAKRVLGVLAVMVGIVATAAVAVAALGPWLLGLVGAEYVLDGWTLLWIVSSAAPMSVLAVTGPLVLAAGLRNAYAAGWLLAAIVAVGGVTLLPGDLVVVALVAISVGPIGGAVVHVVAFARR